MDVRCYLIPTWILWAWDGHSFLCGLRSFQTVSLDSGKILSLQVAQVPVARAGSFMQTKVGLRLVETPVTEKLVTE